LMFGLVIFGIVVVVAARGQEGQLDGHLVEAAGELANHRSAGYAVRLQVEPNRNA